MYPKFRLKILKEPRTSPSLSSPAPSTPIPPSTGHLTVHKASALKCLGHVENHITGRFRTKKKENFFGNFSYLLHIGQLQQFSKDIYSRSL